MHQFTRLSWIALTFLCSTGLASAQPAGGDAVAVLRQALKAPAHDGSAREQAVQQAIAGLHGIGELRHSLILLEWRDDDADIAVAEVDRRLKREVEQRFEQAVREVFAHGDALSQSAVADMLGDIGVSLCGVGGRASLAGAFSADLAQAIQQGPPSVRLAAARALGQVHPNLDMAMPALSSLLSGPDEASREGAVGSLAALVRVAGQVAAQSHLPGRVAGGADDLALVVRAVLPLADRALTDSSAPVRRRAIEAIGWSVSSVDALVGEQGPALLATGADVRTALQPMLRALKDQGPALAHALGDSDGQVRAFARRTMEVAAEVRQRLEKRSALGTDDPLGVVLTAALPALTANIADPDWHARQTTINILELLGPAAAPAAQVIVQALGDPSCFVRWSAVRAVARLAPQAAAAAVPALVALLGESDLDLLMAAESALEQYGPAAVAAAPALAQMLRSGNAVDARVAAIHALEHIGAGAAATSVPAMTAALTDPEAHIRAAAATALGQLGSAARSAVEALQRAHGDGNPEVQKAANEALLRIVTSKP